MEAKPQVGKTYKLCLPQRPNMVLFCDVEVVEIVKVEEGTEDEHDLFKVAPRPQVVIDPRDWHQPEQDEHGTQFTWCLSFELWPLDWTLAQVNAAGGCRMAGGITLTTEGKIIFIEED